MMKRLALLTHLALILSIFPTRMLFGQYDQKTISSMEAHEFFDQLYKVDPRLINGDFYQSQSPAGVSGHPFFFSPGWKEGSVRFGGLDYNDLLLRYDVSGDQVILNTAGFTNSGLQLVLKKDSIREFIMNGYTFEQYPEDDPFNGTRFCQILVEGKTDLLIIRSKKLRITSTGLTDFAYQESESRILRYKGELIPYKNRNSLIRLFPDLKQDLKDYLRNNRLRLRRMKLQNHAEYVSFCNQLIEGSE